jgi:serine/threonine-protein kinase
VTAAAQHDDSAMVGRTLGDAYRVTAKLGDGAMGVVYEAEQVRLKRTVAVKILADRYRENVSALKRFHNEARALVMLEHSHIVRILDFALTTDGRPYLVMERLHGNTVGSYLEAGRRFSVSNTIAIARQVCEALVEAHSKGIFHRDLKPDNLFLVQSPGNSLLVKVLDFGISRLPDSEGPRVTSQSEVIGTPEYMSPEQALGLGDRVNGGADQHGLALVMYEMLSGVSPFAASDVQAALEKVSFEMPALLHTIAPNVSPKLAQVLHRALSKDPQERFAGIDAFMTAAQGAVQEEGPLSVIPRDFVAASMPVARPYSADDPVRTIALLLAQARRASLADDHVLASVLSATALDAAALSDDEAILAVVDMARPMLEGIFTASLEPIERRVFVRPPSAARRRDLTDAHQALIAAAKPQTTIAEVIHSVALPRLDALRSLIDLEARGTVEFRVGVPRPRNSIVTPASHAHQLGDVVTHRFGRTAANAKKP